MKTPKRKYSNARERADKSAMGFTSASLKIPDGVQLFKPKTGVMLIDIIPFEAGEGNPYAEPGMMHWERTFFVHRGIGANGDSYVCPRMTFKGKCPICEHRLKLMKEDKEGNEETIKDLAPKQRQLFNVINRKEPEKGIQLWDISTHLFGKHLDARLRNSDEDDGWETFFFAEGGKTLKIGFAEKTFAGHAYHEVESIDFKDRDDVDEDVLKAAHPLDELLINTPYDALKKTFLEAGDDKDEDDDKDDEPKKKSSKKPAKDEDEDDDGDEEDDAPPAKKKKPAPSEDEDDEDEDEDDEDEKPKSKKKPPVDEDDWDDFDDDEDEKPKAKKKPAKDEDEDDEDEDEDEKPKSKKQFGGDKLGKGFDKAKKQDEEDEDDEDEDEDDEPAPKKKKKPSDDEDDD